MTEKVTLRMQCEDCGHVQTVNGCMNMIDKKPHYWFGSSYNWCDKCESGLPHPISKPEVVEEPQKN